MSLLAAKNSSSAVFGRKATRVPFKAPRTAVRVSAEADSNGVAPSSSGSSAATLKFTKTIPPLTWTQDNESIRDLLAFSGPLPERLNGRLAMWAFVSFALTEISNHTPVADQFAEGWLSAILFSLTLTFASITPKIVSGSSLKDLMAAATTEGMQGEGLQNFVALFNADIELWTGRVAMAGIAGLAAFEAIRGDSFF